MSEGSKFKETSWQKQPLRSPSSTQWPISFACKLFEFPQLRFFPPQKKKKKKQYMLTKSNPNHHLSNNRPDECLEMAYLYLNKYKRFQSSSSSASSSPSQPDPLDDAVRLSLSLKPRNPLAKIVRKKNTILSCFFFYFLLFFSFYLLLFWKKNKEEEKSDSGFMPAGTVGLGENTDSLPSLPLAGCQNGRVSPPPARAPSSSSSPPSPPFILLPDPSAHCPFTYIRRPSRHLGPSRAHPSSGVGIRFEDATSARIFAEIFGQSNGGIGRCRRGL